MHVLYAVRAFMVNNDPKPTVELIKKGLKIYPFTPGGFGTSIATRLEGKVRLEAQSARAADKVRRGRAASPSIPFRRTILPSSRWSINSSRRNRRPHLTPEFLGQLAAIGIVKGKPFAPDARMKKILTDAAAVGNAAGRSLQLAAALNIPAGITIPKSVWMNFLLVGGYNFETPPPMITQEGLFKALPPTGARTLELTHGLLSTVSPWIHRA